MHKLAKIINLTYMAYTSFLKL